MWLRLVGEGASRHPTLQLWERAAQAVRFPNTIPAAQTGLWGSGLGEGQRVDPCVGQDNPRWGFPNRQMDTNPLATGLGWCLGAAAAARQGPGSCCRWREGPGQGATWARAADLAPPLLASHLVIGSYTPLESKMAEGAGFRAKGSCDWWSLSPLSWRTASRTTQGAPGGGGERSATLPLTLEQPRRLYESPVAAWERPRCIQGTPTWSWRQTLTSLGSFPLLWPELEISP